MVIKIDNNIAHSNENPFLTPAKTQSVIVPGPIKAAVIIIAGPPLNFGNIFFQ
jgi:hypothetical protein